MPLPYIAIAFFGLAALVLLWLGRLSQREAPAEEPALSVGMSEAEVLAALGPPDDVRRDGDPLEPEQFAEGIRGSYVYEGRFVIRFVSGIVQEIGPDSPLPEVEGEPIRDGRAGAAFPPARSYYPEAGSLPVDEFDEVDTVPLEDGTATPMDESHTQLLAD